MSILAWPETAERAGKQAIPAEAQPAAERRAERRYSFEKTLATATVMGEEEAQQPCRILDASRSGMRIALKTPLPVGTQIHVRWDNGFFVGASRYSVQRGQDHVLGLELVVCSHTGLPRRGLFGWQCFLTSLADRFLLFRRNLPARRVGTTAPQ